MNAFHVAKKSNQELNSKLQEEKKERKSATAALNTVEKQAKGQRVLLRNAKDQLAASKKQITTLKKKLKELEKAKAQVEMAKEKAEQYGYNVRGAETEDALKAEVPGVCRLYYAQVWDETLNQTRVKASSALRKVENFYYPKAIYPPFSSNSKADTPPEVADPEKSISEKALPSSGNPPKVAE